jgi:hypothetical protein
VTEDSIPHGWATAPRAPLTVTAFRNQSPRHGPRSGEGRAFITVVVDHDPGRLVWAAPGRTVNRFFNELGPSRTLKIRPVSADAAHWIQDAPRCIL